MLPVSFNSLPQDPCRIVAMLTALYAQYENVRDQFRHGDYSALKSDNEDYNENIVEKEKSFNPFQALSEEYAKEESSTLPLLVNTDGFVRYMGAEILQVCFY